MSYFDEPIKVVYRHWICGERGCQGEMYPTDNPHQIEREIRGVIMVKYPHRCSVCMREDEGNMRYPGVTYLVVESSEEETRVVS